MEADGIPEPRRPSTLLNLSRYARELRRDSPGLGMGTGARDGGNHHHHNPPQAPSSSHPSHHQQQPTNEGNRSAEIIIYTATKTTSRRNADAANLPIEPEGHPQPKRHRPLAYQRAALEANTPPDSGNRVQPRQNIERNNVITRRLTALPQPVFQTVLSGNQQQNQNGRVVEPEENNQQGHLEGEGEDWHGDDTQQQNENDSLEDQENVPSERVSENHNEQISENRPLSDHHQQQQQQQQQEEEPEPSAAHEEETHTDSPEQEQEQQEAAKPDQDQAEEMESYLSGFDIPIHKEMNPQEALITISHYFSTKTAEIQSIFSGVVDRLNETFDEFKAAKHQVCSQGVELQVELNTLVENRRKVMKEVNDIGRYIPKKK